MKELADLKKKQ